MRPVIEKYLPSIDQIKTIRERLKVCKDEWLETKPGPKGGQYMGVNTVRQILDYAVDGITYWDFGVDAQWREEIYKYDKQTNSWVFDGYVYHVRGYLFIPGLGHREQYGCKIAIGGKDNQDSAYKAAASNLLVKCASLFGVGESIYSKIKIDLDDEAQYEHMQQSGQYQFQPDGYGQQWNQQQWQGQNQAWQQNQGWSAQTQQWQQPQEFGAPVNYQAQQNPQQAQPQAQVQQNPYQAQPVSYGAPSGAQPSQAQQQQQPQQQPSAIPQQWDPKEIQRIHMHKARLGIQNDEQLNPYIRDFMRDENATLANINPDNLKAFNDYLDHIAV